MTFVERTTKASGVPLQVTDPRTLATIIALVRAAVQPKKKRSAA